MQKSGSGKSANFADFMRIADSARTNRTGSDVLRFFSSLAGSGRKQRAIDFAAYKTLPRRSRKRIALRLRLSEISRHGGKCRRSVLTTSTHRREPQTLTPYRFQLNPSSRFACYDVTEDKKSGTVRSQGQSAVVREMERSSPVRAECRAVRHSARARRRHCITFM